MKVASQLLFNRCVTHLDLQRSNLPEVPSRMSPSWMGVQAARCATHRAAFAVDWDILALHKASAAVSNMTSVWICRHGRQRRSAPRITGTSSSLWLAPTQLTLYPWLSLRSPQWMRSPGRIFTGWLGLMRLSFTQVPFTLPRSVTVKMPPDSLTTACFAQTCSANQHCQHSKWH